MSKVVVIGRHGFLGSAIASQYDDVGSFPTKDTKIIYHFASPVHPPFEENPDYHMNEILQSFLYLLPYCRDHNIKFVYPSSALVYEKDTPFTKTKKIMEMMASMYPKTIGLRIFPVYGPGETRTVISQWCRDMKKGLQPIVWGDGTQERDFIYIDDAVKMIKFHAEESTGIHDIGIGRPVSFNTIIEAINQELRTDIKPIYQRAPIGYNQGIVCKTQSNHWTKLSDGIKKCLNYV